MDQIFFFPTDHLQKNLCIYDFGETFLTHHADLVFKLVYTLQHFKKILFIYFSIQFYKEKIFIFVFGRNNSKTLFLFSVVGGKVGGAFLK